MNKILIFFIIALFCLFITWLKQPLKCWFNNFSDQPWLPSYCLTDYKE